MQLYHFIVFLSVVVFLTFVFVNVDVNCCQTFVAKEKLLLREIFLYFLDNDMDLWVEFWKFVSKCFQVFTWPYVYISMKFQKGIYSNST